MLFDRALSIKTRFLNALRVATIRVKDLKVKKLAVNPLPWLGLLIVQAVSPTSALAQGVDIRHALEVRYATGFEDTGSQLMEANYRPEISARLSDDIDYFISAKVRAYSAHALARGSDNHETNSRSSVNQRYFIGNNIEFELDEAYVDFFTNDGYARIGKQKLVWGQADGLRVLDQINPLNLREFILGDIDDRRIGLWMTKLEHSIGDVTAEFTWIFDHSYNDVPISGPFKPTSPHLVPQAPANFSGRIIQRTAKRPSKLIRDDDYALRLTGFNHGWDWSMNALYFYDDSAAITIENNSEEITLHPKYQRSLLIGGSVSNAFDNFTLRSELAVQSNKHQLDYNVNTGSTLRKYDQISAVVGADFQIDADTLISGQLFLRSQLVAAKIEHNRGAATVLGRKELFNDTLILEGLVIHDFNDSDGVVQLSAEYYLSDEITVKTGVDVFYGDKQGVYGQFTDANRLTVSIDYNF